MTVLAGERPQLVRHERSDVGGAGDRGGGGAGRVEDDVALGVVAVLRPVIPGGGGGDRSLSDNSKEFFIFPEFARNFICFWKRLFELGVKPISRNLMTPSILRVQKYE